MATTGIAADLLENGRTVHSCMKLPVPLNETRGRSSYKSADSIVSDDPNEQLRFPVEFLNKQQPSGLPQHELRLRVGCLIMLLRNIDPRNGLLNGTRLRSLD
ncbi:ATP-dependent DNA helicase [Trichonephila clavata]|uniref:ATP-dependent DNA helicase n=1 Tax=Trichonephila clavata TaxID=2740835 RepID=A0A8X6GER1_TRICU|nr:ATP-dependent DNA helicase [Trichonephila clavata]